jgi:hypothetical protein
VKFVWINWVFHADSEYDISFGWNPKIFMHIGQILIWKPKKLYSENKVSRHSPSGECFRSFGNAWFCTLSDELSNSGNPNWIVISIDELSFKWWCLYVSYIYMMHPKLWTCLLQGEDHCKISFLTYFCELIPNLKWVFDLKRIWSLL